MVRQTLKLTLGIVVVGGCLAVSKKSDADILARVGTVTAAKVRAVAPDAAVVAGPLAGLKPGNALPVEERVRVRIDSDKLMDGDRIDVLPGGAVGEVKLRGVVRSAAQRQLAAALAEGTVGVTGVVNEIAVPEQLP